MKNTLDALNIDMVAVLTDIVTCSQNSQALERGLKGELEGYCREIQQLDAALAGRPS